jgi:hypothetical protein
VHGLSPGGGGGGGAFSRRRGRADAGVAGAASARPANARRMHKKRPGPAGKNTEAKP